jgi:hypothetical protein
VLAYLGPFTATYRQKQTERWIMAVKDADIPCSDNPSLNSTLGDKSFINMSRFPSNSLEYDQEIRFESASGILMGYQLITFQLIMASSFSMQDDGLL